MKWISIAAGVCTVLLLAVSLGVNQNSVVPSCNCVAFRLDDIQDYFLNHVQIHVMKIFEERKMSLTIGVIGNYFGSDPLIVDYVKNKTGDPLFEVANHGWNHEDFTRFDKDGQAALIQRSNEKIDDVLGTRPIVFIAPFNIVNDDTFSAARDSGMRYISADIIYDPPPYDITGNQSLYRVPETALMGDVNADNTDWITFDHQQVLVKIENSLSRYGFAVVTMHPQDFASSDMLNYQNMVDEAYINELEMLLDKLKDHGIKVVTISGISMHVIQELGVSVHSAQSRKEEQLN